MAEIKLTGTIAKASTLTGQINKGVGMGELPQARGLGEFLSPAYSVNGHDLTAVSEAIQSKAGVEAPVWPDGFVKGVGRITEKLEDLETEAGKIGCLVGGEPTTEDQLLADLASANAATGKADTTLHDALISLIAGYGEGVDAGAVVALCAGTLTEISDENFPGLVNLRAYLFYNDDSLVRVQSSTVKKVSNDAFRLAKKLEYVHLPNATEIGQNAFRESSLEEFTGEKVINIGSSCFEKAINLRMVDLHALTRMYQWAFWGCSALETVIIRSANIPSMQNINAFTNSGIANGTGYIYVPSALVEAYKVGTNWSEYANQIRAIEDYPQITGG